MLVMVVIEILESTVRMDTTAIGIIHDRQQQRVYCRHSIQTRCFLVIADTLFFPIVCLSNVL